MLNACLKTDRAAVLAAAIEHVLFQDQIGHLAVGVKIGPRIPINNVLAYKNICSYRRGSVMTNVDPMLPARRVHIVQNRLLDGDIRHVEYHHAGVASVELDTANDNIIHVVSSDAPRIAEASGS